MTLLASEIAHRRPLTIATYTGTALLAALLVGGSPFANREAMAITSVGTAARNSDAQLTACGSNTGTALYGCVADVLNRLCYQIGRSQVPAGVRQPFDG